MRQPLRLSAWSTSSLLGLLVLLGLCCYSAPVRAQSEIMSTAAADAWVAQATMQQDRTDRFGRYIGAPFSVAFAGTAALLPAVLDLAPSTTAAYLSSSALMLTAAIGMWAQPEPYAARRWYAGFAGLGLATWGAGLVLSCTERDEACGKSEGARHLQIGLGIAEAGMFLTSLITSLVLPPPSPTELKLSVQGLQPDEHRARVLEFLRRRDTFQRVASIAALPWGLAMSGVLLGTAHEAASTGGQVLLYGLGGVLLAFEVGAFVYELLREPDAEKLRRGAFPSLI